MKVHSAKVLLLKIILINVSVLVLLPACDGLSGQVTTCEKITACKCAFSNDMGIDLSKLHLSWEPTLNSSVYFQPCSDAQFIGPPRTECSVGAAVCVFQNGKFTLIGKPEEATFVSTSQNDPIFLKYHHINITTSILLQCGGSSSALVLDSSSTSTDYHLTLQSPLACLKKVSPLSADVVVDSSLSAGSVLVIIFTVFLVVYFGCGALVLKLTRGAEGKELVPNYDFWADLPYLVRDGAMFVFNGCKAAASYDRI